MRGRSLAFSAYERLTFRRLCPITSPEKGKKKYTPELLAVLSDEKHHEKHPNPRKTTRRRKGCDARAVSPRHVFSRNLAAKVCTYKLPNPDTTCNIHHNVNVFTSLYLVILRKRCVASLSTCTAYSNIPLLTTAYFFFLMSKVGRRGGGGAGRKDTTHTKHVRSRRTHSPPLSATNPKIPKSQIQRSFLPLPRHRKLRTTNSPTCIYKRTHTSDRQNTTISQCTTATPKPLNLHLSLFSKQRRRQTRPRKARTTREDGPSPSPPFRSVNYPTVFRHATASLLIVMYNASHEARPLSPSRPHVHLQFRPRPATPRKTREEKDTTTALLPAAAAGKTRPDNHRPSPLRRPSPGRGRARRRS